MTLTWHGDPDLKARTLKEALEHQRADRYAQRRHLALNNEGHWRGCPVSCLVAPHLAKSLGVSVSQLAAFNTNLTDWHELQEHFLGIPYWLRQVEDGIFETLAPADAAAWPHRFLSAIPVGVWLRLDEYDLAEREALGLNENLDSFGWDDPKERADHLVDWVTAPASGLAPPP